METTDVILEETKMKNENLKMVALSKTLIHCINPENKEKSITQNNPENASHKIFEISWKVFKYGVFFFFFFSVFSPNAGKYGPEKIPHLDTFHAVPGSSIKVFEQT